MHCFVYVSQRKPDTYVWFSQRDRFDVLPEPLALMLGDLQLALEVELTEQRKLPQEDSVLVMKNLDRQGWHLQTPPGDTMSVANQPNHHRRIDEERPQD
ncbi:MAG TPA: YcgL domain-containing protein [Luteibacter sp.]|jgi:uncharacterized protein|nr:YcgL domain-containing protein [Luteibacter sp.]